MKYNRLKVAGGFKADRKISTKGNFREGSLKREGVLREKVLREKILREGENF